MKRGSGVLSLRRAITALLCAGAVALVWDTSGQALSAEPPPPPDPTTVTVSVSRPESPAPETEDAPEDKPAGKATACSPQRLSGTYSASYGPLECEPRDAGLECCYSANCRWNLHLSVSDDGKKVEGTWDHNDGTTGPVEFGLTEDCELSSGRFGYEAGKLTRGWSVTSKTVPKSDEPEKCESFCIEWVCGVTGSACAKIGNSCDGDTRRDTTGGNICGKGCKQAC
jgi:hypothetical protein